MIRLHCRVVESDAPSTQWDALSDRPETDEYVGEIWRAGPGEYVVGVLGAECGRFGTFGEAIAALAREAGEDVTQA